MMKLSTALAIFVGGGLGSLSRFSMSLLFQRLEATQLPWATFSSNMVSTGILGILLFRYANSMNQSLYFLLIIGFCGGFSTFSTFSLETFQLLKTGQFFWACLNVIGSIAIGLLVLLLLYKYAK